MFKKIGVLQSFVAMKGATVGRLMAECRPGAKVEENVDQEQKDVGGAEEGQSEPADLVPREKAVWRHHLMARIDEKVHHNGQSGYAGRYAPSVERIAKKPLAFRSHGFFSRVTDGRPGTMTDGVEPQVDGHIRAVHQRLEEEEVEVGTWPGVGRRQDQVAQHRDDEGHVEADEHAAAQVAQLFEDQMDGHQDEQSDDTDGQADGIKDADKELEKVALIQRARLADEGVVNGPWAGRRCGIFLGSAWQAVAVVRDGRLELDAVDAVLIQRILVVPRSVAKFVHNVTEDSKRPQLKVLLKSAKGKYGPGSHLVVGKSKKRMLVCWAGLRHDQDDSPARTEVCQQWPKCTAAPWPGRIL